MYGNMPVEFQFRLVDQLVRDGAASKKTSGYTKASF